MGKQVTENSTRGKPALDFEAQTPMTDMQRSEQVAAQLVDNAQNALRVSAGTEATASDLFELKANLEGQLSGQLQPENVRMKAWLQRQVEFLLPFRAEQIMRVAAAILATDTGALMSKMWAASACICALDKQLVQPKENRGELLGELRKKLHAAIVSEVGFRFSLRVESSTDAITDSHRSRRMALLTFLARLCVPDLLPVLIHNNSRFAADESPESVGFLDGIDSINHRSKSQPYATFPVWADRSIPLLSSQELSQSVATLVFESLYACLPIHLSDWAKAMQRHDEIDDQIETAPTDTLPKYYAQVEWLTTLMLAIRWCRWLEKNGQSSTYGPQIRQLGNLIGADITDLRILANRSQFETQIDTTKSLGSSISHRFTHSPTPIENGQTIIHIIQIELASLSAELVSALGIQSQMSNFFEPLWKDPQTIAAEESARVIFTDSEGISITRAEALDIMSQLSGHPGSQWSLRAENIVIFLLWRYGFPSVRMAREQMGKRQTK